MPCLGSCCTRPELCGLGSAGARMGGGGARGVCTDSLDSQQIPSSASRSGVVRYWKPNLELMQNIQARAGPAGLCGPQFYPCFC